GVVLNFAAENFDRTTTTAIIIFEIFILLFTITMLWWLRRYQTKITLRFLVIMIGVAIFEVFTMPMWNNHKLGIWAYVYRDYSWILTVGWSALILTAVVLVDHWQKHLSEERRFLTTIGCLLGSVLLLEALVVKLGIRSYTPEVEGVIWGRIPGLDIPWNTVYYAPVFLSLIVGFYRYWELVINDRPVMPFKNRRWVRDFFIALAAVFMFELMVEPMVDNVGFPAWSYVYRDISIVLTLGWVVLIWLCLKAVDYWFIHYDIFFRFTLYVIFIGAAAMPAEAYFIFTGMRAYGPTATLNFSGLTMPGLDIPTEVVFGIPLYFALVIAFIRYWEVTLDHRRLDHAVSDK
ncbi:MAG: hypothetical protein QGH40_12305, partial [bacterium]|nr:hypothetical protein [bacterium]